MMLQKSTQKKTRENVIKYHLNSTMTAIMYCVTAYSVCYHFEMMTCHTSLIKQ